MDGIEKAWELLNAGKSFFLTGKAGTGKSTLLREIVEQRKNHTVVLAPTGIAAINVGGMTIHSFFKIPPRILLPDDPEIKTFAKGSPTRESIEKMELLIIDEVSMVKPDLLDAIEKMLRMNRKSQLPFGGVQVILIGDLFQLEPVMRKEDITPEYSRYYPGNFFFDAFCFKTSIFEIIQLLKVFRQKDNTFLEILERVRHGVGTFNDLQLLNQKVDKIDYLNQDDFSIAVCSTNKSADQINQDFLNSLTTKPKTYKGVVNDKYPTNKIPNAQKLELKVGSQVMFIKNEKAGRWANGTLAKVLELNKNSVVVELQDGNIEEVEPARWTDISYSFDPKENKLKSIENGSYEQIPLRLAWAITIHKSQGLTFEKMILDLGYGAFAGGQTYVALSRCTSLDGLKLKSKIRSKDIFVNKRIQEFYELHNLK